MTVTILAVRGVAATINRYASGLAGAVPAEVRVGQYGSPLRRSVWGAAPVMQLITRITSPRGATR